LHALRFGANYVSKPVSKLIRMTFSDSANPTPDFAVIYIFDQLNSFPGKPMTVTPAMIDAFERAPEKLRAAVAGLSRADITARPGPGDWSILEVVVHLADSDCLSIDRMKRILIEDNPPLLYADETEYIRRLFPHEQSLEDALLIIEAERRQFARVLRKLPAEAFARIGTHNRKGPVSLGEMVASYVKHIDEHLVYIVKKRERLGKK